MTHRLRIKTSLDQEYVLSRTQFKIIIEIENIGETRFPGGTISNFELRYANLSSQYAPKFATPIPVLLPNEKIELDPIEIYANEEGICWININIKALDEVDVIYYRGDFEYSDYWRKTMYIFRYENMKILEKLELLLQKIDEIISMIGRESNNV